MIPRDLSSKLSELAQKFPVIAILGPRQSGKTTLAKSIFDDHVYLSLEDINTFNFAQKDPYTFFDTHHNKNGIIIDEIQEIPNLMSYIQTYVDSHDVRGYFIITGSQNILLNEAISQTLAGRVAILTLLPLCINELSRSNILPNKTETILFNGSYPRIYAHEIRPVDWYPHYIKTYLERDVRQIKNVHNLSTFQRFVGLCAGRIGQILSVSSLSSDCGIDVKTVNSWLSILEASYLIFLLQPHNKNFNKRLIKSPKIYFYDTGLACSLLGIESPEVLANHYLRGGLFESFILSEFIKNRLNKGLNPNIYFWRDKLGHEIDCIADWNGQLVAAEIKSGRTISQDFFDGLNYWTELSNNPKSNNFVVYGGDDDQKRSAGSLLSWKNIECIFNKF